MTPAEALPSAFVDPLLEAVRDALAARWKPLRRWAPLEVTYEAREDPRRPAAADYEWLRLLADHGSSRFVQLDLVEQRLISVQLRLRGKTLFALRRAHAVSNGVKIIEAFELTASSLGVLESSETRAGWVARVETAWRPVVEAPGAPPVR